MRWCVVLLIATIGACVSTADGGDDGTYTHIEVTSALAFDRVELYLLDTGGPFPSGPPLTPQLQQSGQPAPSDYQLVAGAINLMPFAFTLSDPRTSFVRDDWQLTQDYELIAAVGYRGETVVGAAAAVPSYVYRDSAWRAAVDLSLVGEIEVFGVGNECIRVSPPPPATTYYSVYYDDVDCDGVRDRDDCQPLVTCTPDNPSSCGCAPAR